LVPAVGLGFGPFPFSGPAGFWRWVDWCEDSAIESIFLPERLLAPPPMLEPLITLAAIAGRSRRLKFGVHVLVLPLRDPVVLAKECATLELLSEGRFLPMFGIGNNELAEWAALGVESRKRGGRADEMLEIMSALWTRDQVDYDGRYFQLRDVTIAPRPTQTPMPFWLGGGSEAAIRRTVRYGHGWMGGTIMTVSQVEALISRIKLQASEAGRAIADDQFGASFSFRFGSWDEPIVARLRAGAESNGPTVVGDAAAILERIEQLQAVGVRRLVLRPIAGSDQEMIEQSARLTSEVLPLIR